MKKIFVLIGLLFTMSLAIAGYAPSDIQRAVERGDLDGADRMSLQVIQEHPDNAKAHYYRSQVLFKEHLVGDAASELNTALQLDPNGSFTTREKLSRYQVSLEAQNTPPSRSSSVSTSTSVSTNAPPSRHEGKSSVGEALFFVIKWIFYIAIFLGLVIAIRWLWTQYQDKKEAKRRLENVITQPSMMEDYSTFRRPIVDVNPVPSQKTWENPGYGGRTLPPPPPAPAARYIREDRYVSSPAPAPVIINQAHGGNDMLTGVLIGNMLGGNHGGGGGNGRNETIVNNTTVNNFDDTPARSSRSSSFDSGNGGDTWSSKPSRSDDSWSASTPSRSSSSDSDSWGSSSSSSYSDSSSSSSFDSGSSSGGGDSW